MNEKLKRFVKELQENNDEIHKLKKLKIRWLRWLGQKTREDKSYWTELLNCNWSSWATRTLRAHSEIVPDLKWDRLEMKQLFQRAINCADLQDLIKLDNLYAEEIIEKRGW